MVLSRSIPFLLVTTWGLLAPWASVCCAAGETVLLDFSSPSCGPCRQMRPTIHQLKERGYPVQEIDISGNSSLAARYQITHVPAFVVLVHGQEFARMVGATSYTQLERMLQQAGIRPGGQDGGQRCLSAANTAARNSTTATFAEPSSENQPFAAAPPTAGIPNKNRTAVAHLLESTVRLTVQDPQGNSTGTGTIVDAREGEALVLTCGHLFRSSGGKGTITITLFQSVGQGATAQSAQARTTLEGRLVDFDLDRDLGLVSFRTHEEVQVAPIAPPGTRLAPGFQVTTIGCNHGNNPTAINTQVTMLNRYQGAANIEAAGTPVEGRSGGGMFDRQGQLIGVCFAADPQADEGLYAASSSIQAKLDSLGLAMVYQPPVSESRQPGRQTPTILAQLDTAPGLPTTAQPAIRGQGMAASLSPSEQAMLDDMAHLPAPSGASPPVNRLASPPPSKSQNFPGPLNPSERALMDEIVRRGATSEVIVIIRPKTADGKSEVISFQHASANLVSALVSPPAQQGNAPAMAARPVSVNRR